MQLTHSFSVPATIDVAWATFMDLREVGECFPGATVTDIDGGDHFAHLADPAGFARVVSDVIG